MLVEIRIFDLISRIGPCEYVYLVSLVNRSALFLFRLSVKTKYTYFTRNAIGFVLNLPSAKSIFGEIQLALRKKSHICHTILYL